MLCNSGPRLVDNCSDFSDVVIVSVDAFDVASTAAVVSHLSKISFDLDLVFDDNAATEAVVDSYNTSPFLCHSPPISNLQHNPTLLLQNRRANDRHIKTYYPNEDVSFTPCFRLASSIVAVDDNDVDS